MSSETNKSDQTKTAVRKNKVAVNSVQSTFFKSRLTIKYVRIIDTNSLLVDEIQTY